MAIKGFLNQAIGITDGAFVGYAVIPLNRPGITVCYDRISLFSPTVITTWVTIGLRYGIDEIYLQTFPAVAVVNWAYSLQGRFFADGRYDLFARALGLVIGTTITLTALGYYSEAPY
jgi:hypothetical protein